MPGVRTLACTLLALAALAEAAPAVAQSSALNLEARGGIARPTGPFDAAGGGEVGTGASFGLHFGYRAGPRATVRLGFSQHRFACDGCQAAEDLVHTGWDIGARIHLLDAVPRPWVGLAGVFGRVESHGVLGGGGGGVSDLSAGFDVGGGLEIPLGARTSLTPAVRYAWLDTRFPGHGVLHMRWLVADIGVRVGF